MSYTKGPWEIYRFPGDPPYLIANENEVITQFNWNHPRVREGRIEDNARLIASAPDLLEGIILHCQCIGEPQKIFLWDKGVIEGLRWDHPNGREWTKIHNHNAPIPLHPILTEAIEKATGKPWEELVNKG